MIAVVLFLKELHHLVCVHVINLSQFADRLHQVFQQFDFRDTANGLVVVVHTDVLGLVEPAENAHLRKFRHPREQHETQMGIGGLESGIKTFEDAPIVVFNQHFVAIPVFHSEPRIHHIEQRFVVFVHQDNTTFSRLAVNLFQNIAETAAEIEVAAVFHEIFVLPFAR